MFPNWKVEISFYFQIFKTPFSNQRLGKERERDEGVGDWKCVLCTTESLYVAASVGLQLEKEECCPSIEGWNTLRGSWTWGIVPCAHVDTVRRMVAVQTRIKSSRSSGWWRWELHVTVYADLVLDGGDGRWVSELVREGCRSGLRSCDGLFWGRRMQLEKRWREDTLLCRLGVEEFFQETLKMIFYFQKYQKCLSCFVKLRIENGNSKVNMFSFSFCFLCRNQNRN